MFGTYTFQRSRITSVFFPRVDHHIDDDRHGELQNSIRAGRRGAGRCSSLCRGSSAPSCSLCPPGLPGRRTHIHRRAGIDNEVVLLAADGFVLCLRNLGMRSVMDFGTTQHTISAALVVGAQSRRFRSGQHMHGTILQVSEVSGKEQHKSKRRRRANFKSRSDPAVRPGGNVNAARAIHH
jgi:hypothetical protein